MEDCWLVAHQIKSQITLLLLMVFFQANVVDSLAKTEETTPPPEEISAYSLQSADNLKPRLPRLTLRTTEGMDEASLYVDFKEVVKVRSTVGGFSARERIEKIQERLQAFLREGGSPRDIKPGQEGNQIVIRAGETVLVTVDSKTAQKAKLAPKQLAFVWTNLIRQALGADLLVRDNQLLSSRGFSPSTEVLRNSTGVLLKGQASWYGPYFHGRRTANGERFNMYALTAAHKTLPFNTMVKVTNQRTGKSAIVRITDRGPYAHGRIIDLSKAAAQAIGMLSSGTAPVTVEVLGR